MKFHFNGGLDCPEWILSQISEIAKIETDIFTKLCTTVIERIKRNQLEWTEMDASTFFGESSSDSLFATKLRNIKAIISVLCFIFQKSAKYECSPIDLGTEMLQLGLPAGHIEVLVTIYSMEYELLKEAITILPFKASPFKITAIEKLENSYILKKEDSNGKTSNFVMEMDQLKKLKEDMEYTLGNLDRYA